MDDSHAQSTLSSLCMHGKWEENLPFDSTCILPYESFAVYENFVLPGMCRLVVGRKLLYAMILMSVKFISYLRICLDILGTRGSYVPHVILLYFEFIWITKFWLRFFLFHCICTLHRDFALIFNLDLLFFIILSLWFFELHNSFYLHVIFIIWSVSFMRNFHEFSWFW